MNALVTGASSGIGLQYSRELASRGYNVVMVSNQEVEIKQCAEDIAKEFGVKTYPIFKDLTDSEAPHQLLNYCKENNLDIEFLVNNAGVFFFNPLIKTAEKRINLMLELHVVAVTNLCRVFGEDMASRGKGYILNMSSLSAWMTMPGISIYNATKSYILNMSRSLWYEMREYGVSVTAVCPGAVDTTLYGLSNYWRRIAVGIGVSMRPEKLAKKAINATFKRKKYYIPGAINRPFRFVIKHLPDWAVFFAMSKLNQFQK